MLFYGPAKWGLGSLGILGTSGWQEYRHSKGMAAGVTGRSLRWPGRSKIGLVSPKLS